MKNPPSKAPQQPMRFGAVSLCVLPALLILSGCVSPSNSGSATDTPDAMLQGFVGRPTSELVARFGPPHRKEAGANGVEIWKYFIDRRRVVQFNESALMNRPSPSPSPNTSYGSSLDSLGANGTTAYGSTLDGLAANERRAAEQRAAKEEERRRWLQQQNQPDSQRVVGYVAERGFVVRNEMVVSYFWKGL